MLYSCRLVSVFALLLLIFPVLGQSGSPQSPETIAMVERLARLSDRMDPELNLYYSSGRVRMFRELLRAEYVPEKQLDLKRGYAAELLRSGESLAAVQAFEDVEEQENRMRGISGEDRLFTRLLRATAWLRLGEQQNCISNHTSDSCLLPISGNGVHRLPTGSSNAARILEELLQESPESYDVMWLLNIAHMTLGSYPEKVPEKWRIPESVFASDYEIGKFRDIAGDLGVAGNAVSGGTLAEDFNNDGYLDLMVSGYLLTDQIRLFISDGAGSFEDRTRESGLLGITGGLNLIQADYDNDGDEDVFVLRGAWMARAGRIPNSLLRNNGDGTFSDVTRSAGLLASRPTQTAVWFDYNADGWIDLFVGNETSPNDRHRCELFTNNGDGTFQENSFQSGIKVYDYVKGVDTGDFNNDGRPDLYISILGGENILLRNDGPFGSGWGFTDVTVAAGVGQPQFSFPCWFFDYDNDGWEDLLVFNYDLNEMKDSVAEMLGVRKSREHTRLYRNTGDGRFEDMSKSARMDRNLLAMGVNYGDLDNDGWLDLYVGTGNPPMTSLVPNKMFRNDGGNQFQDVTTSGGFGHLQKGHAIAFADLDLDGDQDIYANMGGAYTGDVYRNALFENPGHGNNWVGFKLEGRESNRSAIGARVEVVVEDEDGLRSIHRTVNSGGSFGSNSLRQQIGIGKADLIQWVELFWPTTGKRQVFDELRPNSFYLIREGDDQAERMDLTPVSWNLKEAGHAHHHHEQ